MLQIQAVHRFLLAMDPLLKPFLSKIRESITKPSEAECPPGHAAVEEKPKPAAAPKAAAWGRPAKNPASASPAV